MRGAVIIPALLLGACSLAPDYLRPKLDFADQWEAAPVAQEPAPTIPARWWEGFHSTALNSLITQALAQNNDITASIARITQARADARIARARLYPQVNATATHSSDISRSAAQGGRRDDVTQAGIAVSYELDLFGANRSTRNAAEYTVQAREFDRDALALIVAGDVTSVYLSLLTSAEQQRLAEENLKINQDVLKIIQAQFDAGRSSALELAQQKTAVATTEATIATLVRDQEISRHQLAVLTGVAPQNYTPPMDAFSSITVPDIATILPSALLEQRPDIRAAEAQLQAANANIGVARAAFFPAATIGLNAGWVESANSAVSLSGDILAPIFRAGALEGALEASKARKEELAAGYRSTVLAAFQESSDALSNVKSAETRFTALAEAATQSQQAYELARARYVNGAIDYQTLLDTQRTLITSQNNYAGARFEQLQAAVNAYKALGGAPDAPQGPTPAPQTE